MHSSRSPPFSTSHHQRRASRQDIQGLMTFLHLVPLDNIPRLHLYSQETSGFWLRGCQNYDGERIETAWALQAAVRVAEPSLVKSEAFDSLRLQKKGDASYQASALESSRRFRERNAKELAHRQTSRRGALHIAKHGWESWAEANELRTARANRRAALEDEEAQARAIAEEEAEDDAEAERAEAAGAPNFSAMTDEERIDWMLEHDPTAEPGYIPKPGELPYFQRGKQRWAP
ncbi:hypothetical protein C8R43DRAFT_1130471 [Mycena crocata]|nr:hypothetical protein C8R43DRAFT_1142182 [Mycena crocata]KAJ7144752.1 hypothetical protein C8R43DRAFT_1130471 [Mycena crocata]